MTDIEGHDDFTLYPLEIPVPNGAHVLGWTVQIKLFGAEGRTQIMCLQSGDLNDWEAAGMVRSAQLILDNDLLGAAHDAHGSCE
jgi:hypothetical protein